MGYGDYWTNGGLGLRNMTDVNHALLAKLGRCTLTHQQSLWGQLLASKYLNGNRNLWSPVKKNSSYTWRSLTKGNDLLKRGMKWRVDNGETIQFWVDTWLGDFPLYYISMLLLLFLIWTITR